MRSSGRKEGAHHRVVVLVIQPGDIANVRIGWFVTSIDAGELPGDEEGIEEVLDVMYYWRGCDEVGGIEEFSDEELVDGVIDLLDVMGLVYDHARLVPPEGSIV
jgi:hypothetical protein